MHPKRFTPNANGVEDYPGGAVARVPFSSFFTVVDFSEHEGGYLPRFQRNSFTPVTMSLREARLKAQQKKGA